MAGHCGHVCSASETEAIAVEAQRSHIKSYPLTMEYRMASRQIKMPVKNEDAEQEVEEAFSQKKRPERGRYLLQVDRQTKNSYATSEAAQSAALRPFLL